jgi:hypothetical protein
MNKRVTFGEALFGKKEHKRQMRRVRQGKNDGVLNIKFKGERFLLIGNLTSGAIAKRKEYEKFDVSYAHLCPDGNIRRYHEIIGTKDDIEVLKKR